MNDAERFWSKVDRSDGCWVWKAVRDRFGYGKFNFGKRMRLAHRVAYELTHGAVEGGKHVMHTCDNRACVNPSHLVLGTHDDNMADMTRKKRFVAHYGAANSSSRLSPESVRAIRAEYAAGLATQEGLANRYGVGQSTVADVVHGRSWSNV